MKILSCFIVKLSRINEKSSKNGSKAVRRVENNICLYYNEYGGNLLCIKKVKRLN